MAWKARLVLFLGFALMAGGLAGSVVSDMPFSEEEDDWKVLKCPTGSIGSQIHCPRLPLSNPILWGGQCHRKWVNNAEVYTALF